MGRRLWRTGQVTEASGRRRVRSRVERGELRRVRRGVYADGVPDRDDELRALFLRLPAGAVLARHSAAERYGFGVLRSRMVHVQLPPTVARPRLPGVVVHHAVLPLPEPVEVDGVPCVPASYGAVDLARSVRRIDALPVLDAALRTGLVTPDSLLAEVHRFRGLPGVRQARELAPLADPRAECRQESQVRLVLIDGRLPAPEPQIRVVDRYGVPRYRIDLGYRAERVGIEYDGASHLDRDHLRRDRDRGNWLDAHGWTMRYFTDRDLYHRPAHIVATVRSALLSRR